MIAGDSVWCRLTIDDAGTADLELPGTVRRIDDRGRVIVAVQLTTAGEVTVPFATDRVRPREVQVHA